MIQKYVYYHRAYKSFQPLNVTGLALLRDQFQSHKEVWEESSPHRISYVFLYWHISEFTQWPETHSWLCRFLSMMLMRQYCSSDSQSYYHLYSKTLIKLRVNTLHKIQIFPFRKLDLFLCSFSLPVLFTLAYPLITTLRVKE